MYSSAHQALVRVSRNSLRLFWKRCPHLVLKIHDIKGSRSCGPRNGTGRRIHETQAGTTGIFPDGVLSCVNRRRTRIVHYLPLAPLSLDNAYAAAVPMHSLVVHQTRLVFTVPAFKSLVETFETCRRRTLSNNPSRTAPSSYDTYTEYRLSLSLYRDEEIA